ncbi:cyclin-dependent kinase inhibitor 1C [Drosophila grimshawi]|uniref:GH18303 n=1 Tax=Drosophila grimshawi TaxID=7222 RepID=B4JFA0_DROGR|nr:cyclin-dependent kinase inhibitor 1C [Drosophila grimshawi]EDV93381.1 GH18303 [Drosophila grimshawi]
MPKIHQAKVLFLTALLNVGSQARPVEAGVLDANGCYRQTIREPVAGNPKLITETVRLICPNGQPQANPRLIVVPAQMVPIATSNVPAAPNHTHVISTTKSNGTHTQTILLHPAPGPGPAPVPAAAFLPAAAPAPAPAPASGSDPKTALAIVYPNQQQSPQPVAPPQVILLSKTVKKPKSSAPTLDASHFLLIFVIIYLLIDQL